MNNSGKITVFTLMGMIILLGASALAGFFLTFRGSEITVVPDVNGMQLEEALIAIQDKGLTSKIQLRYSQNPGDKGKILEQQPSPGSIRRAGKAVTLFVSQGAVIDKIGDYTGWNLQDLKTHFMTLFSTYGTFITIKEPVITVYSNEPRGTIIQQKPLPGTPVNSYTQLELIVSQGPENAVITVPTFKEMNFQEALLQVTGMNLPFAFSFRDRMGDEKPGTVVAQTPEAETEVKRGTMMQLQIVPPAPEEGKVFGLLERSLPDYPVPINLKYQIIDSVGNRTDVFSTKTKGGVIAIPYFVEEDSILILLTDDKEIVNFTVKKEN